MTQDQFTFWLALAALIVPFARDILQKAFSKKKDTVEYSSDLLEIANQATEALRKAREEQTKSEEQYEKTISVIRQEHTAAIASIRNEYDARHERLKNRITELEKVQKIYAIQFDLVTHPNLEVRNISARAMDDVNASQKMRAITDTQIQANQKKE